MGAALARCYGYGPLGDARETTTCPDAGSVSSVLDDVMIDELAAGQG